MNEEMAWVAQAQQGSDEAFTQLVETYQTHVYNLCYRMLGEAEAAEDAAQETFLRAYQHLHRYDRKRPFGTWLLSIAAHYCIDRLRRRKFSMSSIEQDEDEGGFVLPDTNSPNPESEAIYGEQRQQMQAFLKRLEELRKWRKEIAQEWGVESDVVLPRDVLVDLAETNPQNLESLSKIMETLPWRLERFGSKILRVLVQRGKKE